MPLLLVSTSGRQRAHEGLLQANEKCQVRKILRERLVHCLRVLEGRQAGASAKSRGPDRSSTH